MTTTTKSPWAPTASRADRSDARAGTRATPRRVLVATDGSVSSVAAIKLARLMSDQRQWAPEAMTVLEPMPVSVADVVLTMPPMTQRQVSGNLMAQIKRQLHRHGDPEWHLGVHFGSVAPTIVRLAVEREAELIVTGLGRHGRLARLMGAETATRVVRLTSVPVLAVDPAAPALPYTAVAAVDFGESSVRAAHEALSLLQAPGRLHLVHVRWAPDDEALRGSEWERTYRLGVEEGFRRLREELGAPRGIDVTSELRLGAVTETILAAAREVGADLIAAGSHSQNIIDRLLIGSTPVQLLQSARCSVLVTPPAE